MAVHQTAANWFENFSIILKSIDTTSSTSQPQILLFHIDESPKPLIFAIDSRIPNKPVKVGPADTNLLHLIEQNDTQHHFKLCTLQYKNEKVFLNLVNSKRSPRMAFLSGDAKISGDTKVLKSLGKYLKHAKNKSNQSPPTPEKTNRSTSNPAAYHNISFHVEFLPVQETTTDDANIVRYAISCTLNGTTWNEYKRFNDFVKIDNDTRWELRQYPELLINFPRLPSRGTFFDALKSQNSIIEKRRDELELYMEELLDLLSIENTTETTSTNALNSINHGGALENSEAIRTFFNVSEKMDQIIAIQQEKEEKEQEKLNKENGNSTTSNTSKENLELQKINIAQAKKIDVLEQSKRHSILSRVRFYENFGTYCTYGTMFAATAALGITYFSRFVQYMPWFGGKGELPTINTLFHLNRNLLISTAAMFIAWSGINTVSNTDTGASSWKRKLSIFYSTIVVMGNYKWYRWYSKTFGLDAEESRLYLEDTHDVMSVFVFRCMDRWAGFWTKAGQYMSARADVTPPAYCRELRALQDGTKSQPFDEIKTMVERSLKRALPNQPNVTINDIFSRFDEEAMASASIAQVHRAVLRSTGQDVVVKVQHEGIERIMKLDMVALLQICRFVAYFEPEFDFQPMMTEWTKAAINELDFNHESISLMEVALGLSGQDTTTTANSTVPLHLITDVIVPKAIDGFTTLDMMVLEYSPGISVGNEAVIQNLNLSEREHLLQRITEATAHTIFHLGIFNGDPHPGNILVEMHHANGPKPVLLDFGLSKRLNEYLRLAFCKMITSASDFNLSSLIESFEDMGWVFEESADSSETMDIMRFFFRDTAPSKEARKELLEFNRAMSEKRRARKKAKIRRPVKAFPGDILFFVRALELLRGLCSKLQVRQSPLKIMAQSAKTAMAAAFIKHDNRAEYPLQWNMATVDLQNDLQRDVERLVRVLQQEGLISACQICVVSKGNVVVDVALGPVVPDLDDDTADNVNRRASITDAAPNYRSVRSDSIFSSFSVTKTLVATSMHILIQEGKANYSDPVCKYWPKFGQNGKDKITIEEMLSHRTGLHAAIPEEMTLQMLCDWDRMCTFFETAKPATGYDDGMARYHALTYGWLNGKLIEILSGMAFSDFVREKITLPLGLENEIIVGIDSQWTKPTWDATHTAETKFHANRLVSLDKQGGGGTGPDISKDEIKDMIARIKERTNKSKRAKVATKEEKVPEDDKDGSASTKSKTKVPATKQEKLEEMMGEMLESFKGKEWMIDNRMWNSRRVRSACIPAANGHFSARGLAIFYSALMEDGKILNKSTLDRAVKLSATDFYFGGEFGMGYKRQKYQMEGDEEIKIGFGHAGAGGSIGLAVPHAKMSFALTVSRPIQDAEPRTRIFDLICRRMKVGRQTEEMDGIN